MNLTICLAEIVGKPQRDLIDIIAAVGSIGTFLAFIVLILQYIQTRKLQKNNKKQYSEQEKRNNIQQFESSLFNLISLHNQIITNLSYADSLEKDAVIYRGREVFSTAKEISKGMLDSDFIVSNQSKPVITVEDAKEALRQKYHKYYYGMIESNLDHYFRNLYHIFVYIETSTLLIDRDVRWEDTERYKYGRIVRAQLSQDELFAIMLNSLIQGSGYQDFLKLIKKYKILRNFRTDDVQPAIFYELYHKMLHDVHTNTKDGGIVPDRK